MNLDTAGHTSLTAEESGVESDIINKKMCVSLKKAKMYLGLTRKYYLSHVLILYVYLFQVCNGGNIMTLKSITLLA